MPPREIDWSKLPFVPNSRTVPLFHLRASDNERHGRFFQQLVRDGAEFKGILENRDHIPSLGIKVEGVLSSHAIWLFPQMAQFVLCYLLTGDNSGYPKYPKDNELPEFRAEDDYICRHIKREIERGRYICREETKDGINGIRFIGEYPYGNIDYGFFPYSWDELNAQLVNIEAFECLFSENDIPEFDYNTALPREYRDLAENKHLDSVFDEIPTDVIIDKTICGCGATWLEIHSKRNSIIIEPNVPVIIGKVQKHPEINIIGVYGDKLKTKDIAEKIQDQTGYVKIMTTPESYPKVVDALRSLHIPYYKDYFLLFDECEKIVSDIDYRPNIALPIADFFKFQNKAMVSATPIVINDPRFERQRFKVIKVKPQYDYKRLLELKPTNNVNAMVKRTFQKIDKDSMVCFFFNSVKGIDELIDFLGINEQANIYCSTEAKKELHKKDYSRVFDSVTDNEGRTNLSKYNFFTSRFYSAVDIEIDCKPVVIMITHVYKTMKDKVPYSLIDPETEAIQIAGRFRNGIERLIHITDTNSDLEYSPREKLEQFLKEQHDGLHKIEALFKSVETNGEKYIIHEAVKNTEYWQEHYVDWETGEINYFRYNNAYLDERLKLLYSYPAPLNKAYRRSGAFTVISEAEYAIYTDAERQKLKNGSKAEKIEALNDIMKRFDNFESPYDYQLVKELKREYSLWIEALTTIGFAKMKELGFVDSAMSTEIKKVRYLNEATNQKVIEEVYKYVQPNSTYPTSEINEHLKRIFDSHRVTYDRRGVGKSISLYFEAEENRTRREREWILGDRLYNEV